MSLTNRDKYKNAFLMTRDLNKMNMNIFRIDISRYIQWLKIY